MFICEWHILQKSDLNINEAISKRHVEKKKKKVCYEISYTELNAQDNEDEDDVYMGLQIWRI